MQSVRAGAVQTYFFIFTFFLKSRSSKTSFGLHFGDDFRSKCHISVKKGAPKNAWKKLPRQTQTGLYSNVPGPLDSHPKVKDFSNKKQLSEQEARTPAHFWLHFWDIVLKWVIFVQSLFDFRSKLTIHFRLVATIQTISSNRYSISDSKWQFIFDLLLFLVRFQVVECCWLDSIQRLVIWHALGKAWRIY